MSYEVEEIYGIKNILHIALLTYSGDIIYLEPGIFKKYCTSAYNSDDDESDLGCKGDEYSAYNSSYISLDGKKTEKSTAIDNLEKSSSKLKTILNDGIEFSIDSGASHNSDSLVNGCTQFYTLKNLNDSNLLNKEFLPFSGYQHYLSLYRRDTYDWYWRVYYRTVDNYFKYLNCSEENFKFESYNDILCKTYINDSNSTRKSKILGKACANTTLSDSQLWDICFPLVDSDDRLVDNSYKKQIQEKALKYCSNSNKLLNDAKCKQFWNINYNNYFKQSDKLQYLDPIAKDLCKPGHNNYPFCYCIWNEKNPLIYIDMTDQTRRIDDSCVSDLCNADAYKLSDHAEKKCPNACIQTIRANYANLNNLKIDCKLDTNGTTTETSTTTQTSTTTPASSSKEESNNLPNQDNNQQSLFNIKNSKIQEFMQNLNLGIIYPVNWNNILLTEEDIFILLIVVLLLFILIIWKVFGNKRKKIIYINENDEEYENDEEDEEYAENENNKKY
jgi:cbb3-type cytochrome oxidase subunit 3